MKILFLDQSGKLGGAELSLTDLANFYRDNCLVGLFCDGSFKELLEQKNIPVTVLTNQKINVRKTSSIIDSLGSISSIIPLIAKVAKLARNYDLIYANTQKALVVGALASILSRRPLVYHLRDILSADHFSRTNRWIAVTLANRFSSLVITNSKATQAAFIEAGGRIDLTTVVYNGFEPNNYRIPEFNSHEIRQKIGFKQQFIVGHFSRLSPWKGQHILLEALSECPSDIAAIFVGDALFGEQDYVEYLHQQVTALNLEERVKFIGFRSDIVPLMKACDLIAHTSTAPEPFGRVIVEAMLCDRPIVASAAGGVIELIETDKTGWLFPPGNSQHLAQIITTCYNHPKQAQTRVNQAKIQATQRFDLHAINHQIDQLLQQLLS
ncbi:MAG TPA: glycosyltransferase family 1 protein [Cyanobacteria bacterium UBA11370]|nr:glycosyltransferase family 1 protein [Cyanobacteria bacterium UBA11370]HBY80777.1 glycosyltransferase family 1 protein [Cyanobacteria bacterium UBA11148]